ncbi:TPA: hypothetical protein N2F56_004136 [Salmonella enterica]|nr:hypothetical protein [Salmonella enterica subsp. houtenae]HCL4436090.1 hypothetical protein [Salmonella enterica]HCL5083615.1 hypothetical protein [Salmonella enterica]
MDNTTTICPFCHSVVLVGTRRCTSCGATIEYSRIPPRYFLVIFALAWAIIGCVHLLCDEAGLRGFLLQLGIATVLCLLFWLKSIRVLNKRYKGRIRYTR